MLLKQRWKASQLSPVLAWTLVFAILTSDAAPLRVRVRNRPKGSSACLDTRLLYVQTSYAQALDTTLPQVLSQMSSIMQLIWWKWSYILRAWSVDLVPPECMALYWYVVNEMWKVSSHDCKLESDMQALQELNIVKEADVSHQDGKAMLQLKAPTFIDAWKQLPEILDAINSLGFKAQPCLGDQEDQG